MVLGIGVDDTDHMLMMIAGRKTCKIAMKSIDDGVISGWKGHDLRTVLYEGGEVQEEAT